MLDSDGVRHPLAKSAHVINVYLNSAFAVTSQAAEEMAKNEPLASNQRGVIINTASIAGFEGQPGQAAYSAAKGGIIAMTLTVARDLAERGIRVKIPLARSYVIASTEVAIGTPTVRCT